MKKHLYALVIFAGIVTGCSSDNEENMETDPYADLYGTYILTELSTAELVDHNLDGTPSYNLVDELPCMQSNTIVVQEDGHIEAEGGTFDLVVHDNQHIYVCKEGEWIETVISYKLNGDYLSINGTQYLIQDNKLVSNRGDLAYPEFVRVAYQKMP